MTPEEARQLAANSDPSVRAKNLRTLDKTPLYGVHPDRTTDASGEYVVQKSPEAPSSVLRGAQQAGGAKVVHWLTFPYPVSMNRIARAGHGGMFVSKEAKAYKEICGQIARHAVPVPFSGRVSVSVTLCPRKPKRATGKPVRCLDLDNAMKNAIDAMNGILWLDDAQVWEIHAKRGEPVDGGSLVVSIEAWEGEAER